MDEREIFGVIFITMRDLIFNLISIRNSQTVASNCFFFGHFLDFITILDGLNKSIERGQNKIEKKRLSQKNS